MWDRSWAPYVPVAKRRAQAAEVARKATKNGQDLSPVRITGRRIATTFWGKAWCDNLERYSDFSNRLPRGRTYVRNGSVIDLKISSGKITALVSGSSLYRISIDINQLANNRWQQLRRDCANSIHSLMDLLRGKFSQSVMERLTDVHSGLFPSPKEIKMKCSCPDGAYMCKHLAAVLYGVGSRLDSSPEMLFLLRAVNHQELIDEALAGKNLDTALVSESSSLDNAELSAMFGIELATSTNAAGSSTVNATKSKRSTTNRSVASSDQAKPSPSKRKSAMLKVVSAEPANATEPPKAKKLKTGESKPSRSRKSQTTRTASTPSRRKRVGT